MPLAFTSVPWAVVHLFSAPYSVHGGSGSFFPSVDIRVLSFMFLFAQTVAGSILVCVLLYVCESSSACTPRNGTLSHRVG